MKLPEAAKIAVETRNAPMAVAVCDALRMKCRYTFNQTVEFFEKHAGRPDGRAPDGNKMNVYLDQMLMDADMGY